MPEAEDRMLSPRQAADYLGMSERFVRECIARKRIPYSKIGRLVKFDRADLDAFIAANRVEAQ